MSKTPYCRKAVYQAPAPHNTRGSCWLGTALQFHLDMRGEGGSQITSKSKQGAHIHQPTAQPLPHACAQAYHAGRQPWAVVSPILGFNSMAWPSVSDQVNLCKKTLSCKGESFKCQFHTTHVGAVGWEPHSSSTTTCAGKADLGFGVCVPLTLIFLLKIVN